MNICAILYNDFETLDMFGPVEMLGATKEFDITFYSLEGGVVTSFHGVPVETKSLRELDGTDGEASNEAEIILLPGGMGVYEMLENEEFIARLALLAAQAKYVLSVCNGAFLYAKAGVLDGKLATTFKGRIDRAEEWYPQVKWQRNARWTVDGNLYVSSGVSAGTDMALGFIADLFGQERAQATADYAEYTWNSDPTNDPFAK